MRTLKRIKRSAPTVENHFEPAVGLGSALPNKRGQSKVVVQSQRDCLTSLIETPEFGFRLLKPSERVMHGDYIENGNSDYRLWDGPTGFQADSFLNKVYRTVSKS